MLNFQHIDTLRRAELEAVVDQFPAGARVLDLGAGSGQQALELADRGFLVDAVDLESSDYRTHRLFPVIEYDGRTLPFSHATFDVVFSSNVLEHVPDLTNMHAEIARVLKPEGIAIHIMPTQSWRFWTTIGALPSAVAMGTGARSLPQFVTAIRALARSFLQKRHGERGNVISEYFYFRPAWWRRNFQENGYNIVRDTPVGLFYTGNSAMGDRVTQSTRGKLASILGSACHAFTVRPIRDKHADRALSQTPNSPA